MKNLFLITVSGPDKPGITSTLMTLIVKEKKEVVDMGQSVTHGLLSLSILIDMKDEKDSPLLKELLFEAKQLGMELNFQQVGNEHIKRATQDERFILSCVGINGLTAKFIADTAMVLAANKINISRIDNVGGEGFKSLDFTTNTIGETNWKKLKEDLLAVSDRHKIDVAFLRDNVFRRNKRLIVFDMDSTLIQAEVIDEMAAAHGVGEQVKKITELAMEGKYDFNQSIKERVKLLKGLETKKMEEIAKNLPLTPGVEEFVKTVKSLGYKVALISGGFHYFATHLKSKLGLDYSFANDLEIEDGKLTGELKGTIVNGEQKAVLLDLIAQQEGISLEQVVAVGDGANDLGMLSRAGLGIAFHAKTIVKEKAQQSMGHGPMTSILYFLGIPGPSNYQEL